MKKYLIFVLTMILAIILMGCSSSKEVSYVIPQVVYNSEALKKEFGDNIDKIEIIGNIDLTVNSKDIVTQLKYTIKANLEKATLSDEMKEKYIKHIKDENNETKEKFSKKEKGFDISFKESKEEISVIFTLKFEEMYRSSELFKIVNIDSTYADTDGNYTLQYLDKNIKELIKDTEERIQREIEREMK